MVAGLVKLHARLGAEQQANLCSDGGIGMEDEVDAREIFLRQSPQRSNDGCHAPAPVFAPVTGDKQARQPVTLGPHPS